MSQCLNAHGNSAALSLVVNIEFLIDLNITGFCKQILEDN